MNKSASINYHDRKTYNQILSYRAMVSVGAKEAFYSPEAWRSAVLAAQDVAMRCSAKAYARHVGLLKKYKPHQGKKECARRAKQHHPEDQYLRGNIV